MTEQEIENFLVQNFDEKEIRLALVNMIYMFIPENKRMELLSRLVKLLDGVEE